MAAYNLKVELSEDPALFYFIAGYSVLYPAARDRLLARVMRLEAGSGLNPPWFLKVTDTNW